MEREALSRIIVASEYLISGRSIAWVAREFGLSTVQVSHLKGLLGLEGRTSPSAKSLEKYDQVEQAILEEWPVGEIEKTFGVHRKTIDQWFPDRPKLSPQEIGELGQVYRESNEARRKARERGKWTEMFE